MSENSSKDIKYILTVMISIMTISLPVLFLIGYFYDQGYLLVFGLNDEFFPRNIQDYLVKTFFVVLNLVSKLLVASNEHFYVFIFIAILIFVLTVFMVYLEKYEEKISEYKTKIREHKLFDFLALPIFVSIFTLITPYLFISFFGIIILITAGAYWQGQKDANEFISNFKGCNQSDLKENKNCVILTKNENIVLMGMFVAKSSTHLALWDGFVTEVYPLNNEKITIWFGEKNIIQ